MSDDVMKAGQAKAAWHEVAFFGCLAVLFIGCWMAGRNWMLCEVRPTVAAMDAQEYLPAGTPARGYHSLTADYVRKLDQAQVKVCAVMEGLSRNERAVVLVNAKAAVRARKAGRAVKDEALGLA